MKLDGKNIICVFLTTNQFFSELFAFLIYAILHTHNLLKSWTIAKTPPTNTDHILTIKFYYMSIHSNF